MVYPSTVSLSVLLSGADMLSLFCTDIPDPVSLRHFTFGLSSMFVYRFKICRKDRAILNKLQRIYNIFFDIHIYLTSISTKYLK